MRNTKIIATLGPATESAEMIGRLIDAGLNVARLNMSHATHAWVRRMVALIRDAAKARRVYVGILMDTQGPAIRTGDLPAALDLKPGQKFTLTVRGDLGIECPYEELPIIQRKVVKTCLRVGKPVIVATHMLESMIENPVPTRAEITDVANAVFEQSDAIMLSGETTVGKYPVRCVEVFDRVARRIERSGGANYQEQAELVTPRQKLVKSAVVMANELKAEALVVFTLQGNMARYASWMRPRCSPIYAICEDDEVAATLVLDWGITPIVIPFDHRDPARTISLALQTLVERNLLHAGNTVVIVGAISAEGQMVDTVQMRVME